MRQCGYFIPPSPGKLPSPANGLEGYETNISYVRFICKVKQPPTPKAYFIKCIAFHTDHLAWKSEAAYLATGVILRFIAKLSLIFF